MSPRRKPSKYLITLSLILLAIGLTMFGLVYQAEQSLRHDARILNEAGIVRGSIQRITKLVLYEPGNLNPQLISQTDRLLRRFIDDEHRAFFDKNGDGQSVIRMNAHWLQMKQLLQQYMLSPTIENRQQLVASSEDAWRVAQDMVAAAQQRSELKGERIQGLLYFMLFLVSLGSTAVVAMLIFYVRRKLEHESARDHLTGLYNRRTFDAMMTAEIARSERYGTPLSLLIIDIDYFKSINDALGHKSGDRVLVEIARLMASFVRKTDHVFRIGGEEFAVVAPGVTADVVFQMAEQLREKVKGHKFSMQRPLTISIGISEFVNGESSDTLFQRADQALYHAKFSGRDVCCKAYP